MLEFVKLLPWFIKFARLNNDYLGMQNPLRRMERPGLCKYLEFTNKYKYIQIYTYLYIYMHVYINLRLQNI